MTARAYFRRAMRLGIARHAADACINLLGRYAFHRGLQEVARAARMARKKRRGWA
jgi:hypothetical protein